MIREIWCRLFCQKEDGWVRKRFGGYPRSGMCFTIPHLARRCGRHDRIFLSTSIRLRDVRSDAKYFGEVSG